MVSLLDTLGVQYSANGKLIQHPPEFNIQLVSLLDTLHISILKLQWAYWNPPEFNIQLQWA